MITFWQSLTNIHGTYTTMAWADIAEMLLTPRKFMGRENHPGWSPAEFDPPIRALENVQRVSMLCLDYDGGEDLATTIAKFAKYEGLYHTTRSHREDAHRFRVVLRLDRPVTPKEFAKLWRSFHKEAGNIDEKPKDPSRFWYMPGVAAGGPFKADLLKGAPLCVDEWLAKVKTPEPRERKQRMGVEERASRYVEKMGASIEGAGGHQACWAAALVLVKGFDLDEGTALDLLHEFNDRCDPPWSDRELEHKIANAMKSRAARGFLLDQHVSIDLTTLPMEPEAPEPKEFKYANFRTEAEKVWDNITNPTPEKGFTTGCRDLDEKTGGLRRRRVVVVGASTSWGKSSFACMVYDENHKVGVKTLIVSTEDAPDMYVSRILTRRSRATAERVREATLEGEEYTRFCAECGSAEDAIVVLDAIGKPVEWVVEAIKHAVAEHGIQIVICDYLQRFGTEKHMERRAQVNYVMTKLCDVLKATGVAGVILSQLRRLGHDEEPSMHQLKESGDIENMAEVVLLGNRTKYEDVNDPDNPMKHRRDVMVGKNKEGGLTPNPIKMYFDERIAAFYNNPMEAHRHA